MFKRFILKEWTPEMQDWVYEQGWSPYHDYFVSVNEVCTKHVFMPTEHDQNEYMHDGWQITFNDNDKAMQFKLVWSDAIERTENESLGV